MIGALRHRIIIQSRSSSNDDYGGQTAPTWSTHATVFASVQPARASERFFAQKLEHNVTHVIRIRNLSTVTSAMRVLFGSRVFKIHGVTNPDERGRWTDLQCEEGAGS